MLNMASSSPLIYINDPNGCPARLINGLGQMLWAATYNAEGKIATIHESLADNPLRLQGQYADKETGLSYNRHRYFEPAVRIFISQDPLGLLAGESLYNFGPCVFTWIDPHGLSCGRLGERIAKKFLKTKGFKILGSVQNKSGHGIDLVARDSKGVLHFFEVKTSSGLRALPLSAAQKLGSQSFVISRLQRAASADGAWSKVHSPNTASTAVELLDEIKGSGGKVSGQLIRITLGDGKLVSSIW